MVVQNGCTALFGAAEKGSPEVVAALLAADGIDVNAQANVRGSVGAPVCR